ncbi:MAG: hypothetical protein KAG66_00900, partial [Methylococcales bacterium]|nr:hypothetical protein [Methylococcales bacterium]
YLKMQGFKGAGKAREEGNLAREGNFNRSGWRGDGKLFQTKSKGSTAYTSYDAGQYSDAGRRFKAGGNRSAMKSLVGASRAHGTLQSTGYRENSALTMDDVKKMVSPNTYSRGTGLSN